jgi:hypothetical protein
MDEHLTGVVEATRAASDEEQAGRKTGRRKSSQIGVGKEGRRNLGNKPAGWCRRRERYEGWGRF